MTISIIIPTYNEEQHIGPLITFLKEYGNSEVTDIIIADAGSDDNTVKIATEIGATVITCCKKGRAVQMNRGAALAKGDILYFIHADTLPPNTFVQDIFKSVKDGFDLGRYTSKFKSDQFMLRFNEWVAKLDLFMCMGGDQTLFIRKSLFDKLGGFNEEMLIMEEYEFCKRARTNGKYKVMNGAAFISARKYNKNSWLRVQLANAKIMGLYKKGVPQELLFHEYKKLLHF
ncbi:MAG: TIGR04283 family arsenosugar biosynthesis glycosyltransferase [Ferruginibacter sp.]